MTVRSYRRCSTRDRGEESRRQLGPEARLVTTISAGSHFEAMAAYYRLVGWGEYTTNQPQDYQPYPQEWILEQSAVPGAAADRPRE